MKEKCYTVYMHICPNNKKYIGITKLKPNERWKNGKSYKNCVLFNRAIQKYGWENIEHIILFKKLSKEEAEEKEVLLIKEYKTNNNKYGYNIESGGHVNCVSDETKKKISEATKKAMQRPEIKRKMSIAQRNRISPLKGRKLSDEHKEKLRISHIGKGIGKRTEKQKENMRKNNKRKKKILCVETKEVFESINEAGRQTGIDYRNIHRSCNNGKFAGGYHWKYYKLNTEEVQNESKN